MADGLLGRWSQRKLAARQGPSPAEPVQQAVVPADVAPPNAAPPAAEPQPAPDDAAGAPTLEQARALTPASDFSPFVARGVAPEVRNAAMKQLFADPHFNVMDRMDVYIDDYGQPDPIPQEMLRRMASAQFLKLFDDAPETATPTLEASEVADGGEPPLVAHWVAPLPPAVSPEAHISPEPEKTDHADPDLRLQPDHAAAGAADRRGTG